MQNEFSIDAEAALRPTRVAADRLMLGALCFLLLACLVFAALTATWGVALAVGFPAVVIPYALYRMAPGSLLSRLAMAAAFMIFAALTIQQARGQIESHFGIFVLLAFLLYYRDWRPIVFAAGVIAVHHLTFNFMQAANLGVFILKDGPNLQLIIVHAAYVVFETGVLAYMAHSLRSQALEGAWIANLAEQIGRGDLTTQTADNLLQGMPLLGKVSQMQLELGATLGRVRNHSQEVDATSRNMSRQAEAMDRCIQEQGEATQSISANIEELTTSISHLSESAQEAYEFSERSSQASENGATVVKSAIGEMQNIASAITSLADSVENMGSQFNRVAGVVGLIKDIADQTNLLALNAAIEAARAGEQGRGFAVVADEVRTLAERTRKATEEITVTMQDMRNSKDLALTSIKGAVSQADRGLDLAQAAVESIDTIGNEINGMRNRVTDISSGLREQSMAATDVAGNIERISRMADSSAEAATTTAQDAAALTRIADELANSVVRFRLPA